MRSRFASEEAVEVVKRFGAVELGQQTLARLGEALDASGEADLVIERELAAPLARVWQAWSSAEALGAWWGQCPGDSSPRSGVFPPNRLRAR